VEIGSKRKPIVRPFTSFYTVFILASAFFMNRLAEYIERLFGRAGEEAVIAGLLILGATVFFIVRLRRKEARAKDLFIVIFLTAGAIILWQVKNPAERIHVVEYSFLGILVLRDFRAGGIHPAPVAAFALCVLVGLADELIQLFLPYRVFDVRDLVFNASGAVWGIAIFMILTYNKYRGLDKDHLIRNNLPRI